MDAARPGSAASAIVDEQVAMVRTDGPAISFSGRPGLQGPSTAQDVHLSRALSGADLQRLKRTAVGRCADAIPATQARSYSQ